MYYCSCCFLFLLMVPLSLDLLLPACLYSLTPHGTSLTIIPPPPPSINHQSTQYSHLLLQYRYVARALVDESRKQTEQQQQQQESLQALPRFEISYGMNPVVRLSHSLGDGAAELEKHTLATLGVVSNSVIRVQRLGQ